MTEIRQVAMGMPGEKLLPPYQLATQEHSLLIGRHPDCQLHIDENLYSDVSRRHAELRRLPEGWELCDLNSANGTYLNGQRLLGCQRLQDGDRFQLASNGPVFVFEAPPPPQPQPVFDSPLRAQGSPNPNAPETEIALTKLFPVVSTGRNLVQKAFLVPGIFTVVCVALFFATLGRPSLYNFVLAVLISGLAYYFIYNLCGKHKPWWLLLGCTIATVIILVSPILLLFIVVFRGILPGNLALEGGSNLILLLVGHFFGAGLMEELLKAVPVFGLWAIARNFPLPRRDRLGVVEPLDGILLAAACAVGFTLLETLGQYVPMTVAELTPQAGEGVAELVGLQLLIPRILGSVAGHMAYSGYFGYFIGLSVLKPRHALKILGVGYLTASGLHALWNALGSFAFALSPVLGVLTSTAIGVLSYVFLTGAILKARELSPTRSQNFATRLFDGDEH